MTTVVNSKICKVKLYRTKIKIKLIETSESDKCTWEFLSGEGYCQALCIVNRPSEDCYKKYSKYIGIVSYICVQISEICCKICGKNIYLFIYCACSSLFTQTFSWTLAIRQHTPDRNCCWPRYSNIILILRLLSQINSGAHTAFCSADTETRRLLPRE